MAIIRPDNLLKPFAEDGGRNVIPVASQIGIGDSGAASYTDGFPPLNRTPIAAGGIPPKGLDMNGVLYEATRHIQWLNAGGQARFDAALATAIGGYPVGVVLQSNDGLSAYVNVAAANTANFNTTPASIGVSWLLYSSTVATAAEAEALVDASKFLTPATLGAVLAARAGGQVAGAFSNLKAAATGANANVSVSANALAVSDGNSYRTLTALALTINSAAAGVNGLDAGTLAASTWYSVWAIWDGTTAAGLLSLSATAPTLPAGYTHKARVGWARTDATANKYPLGFTQSGRSVRYKVAAGSNVVGLPQMASGVQGNPIAATPTWVSVSTVPFSPPTAYSITVVATNSGANTYSIVAPNSAFGNYASLSNPPVISAGSTTGGAMGAMQASVLLESQNVSYASNTASSSLNAYGWEDNL